MKFIKRSCRRTSAEDGFVGGTSVYRSDHSIVSELFAFRQGADAEKQLKENVDGIEEVRDTSTEFVVNVGGVE